MTALVIDTTAPLAAIFPERHSEAARVLLLRVAEAGAVVPAIWHLDIANTLLAAERRAVLSPAQREDALAQLALLPIGTDPETASRAWSHTLSLARDHALSLHDAAYLELAMRRHLPLATFDATLLRAAETLGVGRFRSE